MRAAILAATFAFAVAVLSLDGCSYLHYTAVQGRYQTLHDGEPRQWLAKHLIGKETWFVYGRLLDTSSPVRDPMAVVALSSRYLRDEVVEVYEFGKAGTYFGMNLPAGEYRLVVLADLNRNGTYEPSEAVGERRLELGPGAFPGKVAGGIDILLAAPRGEPDFSLAAPLAVTARAQVKESVFFPGGTIRSLEDPVFSDETGQLGIYDPAAFSEVAPTMFYALEDDVTFKVPVVFVHGIGGSPRQFAGLVTSLDRKRYKPWFFYYPAGKDLNQVAQLFYDIFLSGKVIPDEGSPMVLVAHSLGGLVVREAMNLRGQSAKEPKVALVLTMASPFGGDPAARTGVDRAPMVPPSWRNLDPGGPFITGLFRKPLPASTEHHLVYAYLDKDDIARGGDGTVALSRQLPATAVAQATQKHGFRTEHTALLRNPAAIAMVAGLIDRVKGPYPEAHMRYLLAGGFDVALGPGYSAVERYMIATYGCYFRAVASGELDVAFPEQRHFIDVAAGKASPVTESETAWLKFRADYPDLASGRRLQ